MKLLLILVISLLIACTLKAQTLRLSAPIVIDTNSETFGSALNTNLPQIQLSELLQHSTDHVGKPFLLKTKIAKVCQNKGCFFIAQDKAQAVRITFKDYAFFIPTDSSGKTVVLNGELVQKDVSKKQAKHFNTDLHTNNAPLQAGEVFEIIATSVKIPLS